MHVENDAILGECGHRACERAAQSNSKTKKYDLVVWDFPHFSTTFRLVSLCTAVEIRFPTRAVFSYASHKFFE